MITILCAIGLYASLFMLGKSRRAERGQLSDPSVVQTPRARLFGGTPNAVVGSVYYPALAIAAWAAFGRAELAVLVAVAAAAAAVSAFLAYSLLFVTRMPCIYCWTSHVANWALLLLTALLLSKAMWP
ncbi:MAG TPA: vitamin K epoxide reductase family protein [Candidatus Baltobacteraceae bacterium]|jgi:uncharacterized membrane protein|nr:vitamin K epoxide reductase family protein [Candidatus Baltobacteraceae bacterium]